VFRRILFIGALPLLSDFAARKACFGVFFALFSLAIYREIEPFRVSSTNVVIYVAQYAILLTYGGALILAAKLNDGLNPTAFGAVLVGTNILVLVMAFFSRDGGT
jgi:Co/Zn/Cd efflux system component